MTETAYEEYPAEHGEMIYSNVGVSMLPRRRQGRGLFTRVLTAPLRILMQRRKRTVKRLIT